MDSPQINKNSENFIDLISHILYTKVNGYWYTKYNLC